MTGGIVNRTWGGAAAAPPPDPPTGLRTFRAGLSAGLTPSLRSELAELRIEGVAEPVAEQVKGKHHEQDGEPGKHGHPPRARHELAAFGDHGAPGRGGRRNASAEEGQR